MRLPITLFCFALMASAQPGIAPPRLGLMTDDNRSLHPVLGIAGNLILGDSLGENVSAVASSGLYSLVKTDAALMVLDRQNQMLFSMDASAGPALFAFALDGSPALVYLPQTHALLAWRADHLEPVPFNLDALGGEALALAGDPNQPTFLVQRDDGIWRVDIAGQTALPGIAAPVLLTAEGSLVYSDGASLVLRDPGGPERRIDTSVSIGALRQMTSGWIEVRAQDTSARMAVRVIPGREIVSQIPEVQ